MGKRHCHNLQSIIKKIDLFGTHITFRINNDLEYKSIIGGCSTIIVTLFIIVYSIYYSYGFILRKNIDFIYSTKIVEKDPFINLTEVKFNLAFGIQRQDDGTEYIYENESFFNYSIESIEWIGMIESEQIIQNLNISYCTKDDFSEEVYYSFEGLGLDTIFCPKIKSFNYTLQGLYTDNYYKFLRLNLTLSEYGMKHLNEVDNYLKKNPLEMAIYFIDTTIDYENKKKYISPYINYIYKGFDLNFTKFIHIYMSIIEFINDENLIFDNPSHKLKTTLDYSSDGFRYIYSRNDNNITDNNLLGQIIIKASPRLFQLNRKYQKLPSFIADLCGILEEIIVLTLLFVHMIEIKLIDDKLISKMLKFRGSKYYDVDYFISLFESDNISNNIMNIIKIPNLIIEKKENFSFMNKSVVLKNTFLKKKDEIKTNKNSKKSYIDNIISPKKEEEIKQSKIYNSKNVKYEKTNNLKLETTQLHKSLFNIISKPNILNKSKNLDKSDNFNSFFSLKFGIENTFSQKKEKITKNVKLFPLTKIQNIYATIFSCCNDLQKKRYEIIKKAESKIHYYLDICSYIKKMQEIDLIKYCMFDNEQINLFDFLSKPPIKIGNENEEFIYQEFQKNQKVVKRLGKKEMNLIYNSYINIRNKKEVCFEDIKLLRLVKAEVDFHKN